MNGTELFTKLNELDSDLIEETLNYKPKKRKSPVIRWYALASCLAVILVGGVVGKTLLHPSSNSTVTPVISMKPQSSDTVPSGILIPKIALPESATSDSLESKMFALIVYQDSIYTATQSYEGDSALEVSPLVGDYLGTAKRNIDEWSSKSAYAKEFSSNVNGEVYTVNGYDSSFRICTKKTLPNEDGTSTTYITFYENLNGIYLDTGYDLFNKRLHLSKNWSSASYQTHKNWEEGIESYHPISDLSNNQMDNFLEELSSAKFVDMTSSSIYDQPSRHFFLTLNDNTTIELRLFKGGYVAYQPLGWYCVKLPDDIFSTIYNVCN